MWKTNNALITLHQRIAAVRQTLCCDTALPFNAQTKKTISITYLHIYISIYLSIYLFLSIYLYLPLAISNNISMYLYICIYLYLYLSIYVYIYIYMYIYIFNSKSDFSWSTNNELIMQYQRAVAMRQTSCWDTARFLALPTMSQTGAKWIRNALTLSW